MAIRAIKMAMTESAFRVLHQLYASPRGEGVINRLMADGLEKLGLVTVTDVPVLLPPYYGGGKRLVRLTRRGTAWCRRRASSKERSVVGRTVRQRPTVPDVAEAIPPAFLFSVTQWDR